MTEKTIEILAGYRKNFSAQNHPPGQLVMPERLKEFAMYMLAMLKSRAFKGGSEPTDRRVHDMRMVRAMGAAELSVYLYPRVIPIHNLQPEDGFPDETGHLRLPPALRASFLATLRPRPTLRPQRSRSQRRRSRCTPRSRTRPTFPGTRRAASCACS